MINVKNIRDTNINKCASNLIIGNPRIIWLFSSFYLNTSRIRKSSCALCLHWACRSVVSIREQSEPKAQRYLCICGISSKQPYACTDPVEVWFPSVSKANKQHITPKKLLKSHSISTHFSQNRLPFWNTLRSIYQLLNPSVPDFSKYTKTEN